MASARSGIRGLRRGGHAGKTAAAIAVRRVGGAAGLALLAHLLARLLANVGQARYPSANEGRLAHQAACTVAVEIASRAAGAALLALLLLRLGLLRRARRIHTIQGTLARPRPTRRVRPALTHLPSSASAGDHLCTAAEAAAHLLPRLFADVGRAKHPDVWLAHQAACAIPMEVARGAAGATPFALLLRLLLVIRRIHAVHETLSRPSPARRVRPASAHLPSSAGAVHRLPVGAETATHLLATVMPKIKKTVRARRRRACQVAQARAVEVTNGAPDATILALVPA